MPASNFSTIMARSLSKSFPEPRHRASKTEWHRVVAWNSLGERVATSLRQGDPVLVEGTLVSSSYDREYGKPRCSDDFAGGRPSAARANAALRSRFDGKLSRGGPRNRVSRPNLILAAVASLAACVSFGAIARPQSQAQHETEMHPGRIEPRAFSDAAKLSVQNDAASQQLILRLGPVKLPAHSDAEAIAQPRDSTFLIPIDGWLVAYHPALVDAAGAPLPGRLLHHADLWNVARSDLVCPAKEEHIFGAGSELGDWPELPGYGYAVRQGTKTRIGAMFANPTQVSYPGVYLELRIAYRTTAAGALKNVSPMWMSVEECGDSSFTLEPGRSTTTARITIKYPGALLAIAGHLHDYGRDLLIQDLTFMDTLANLVPRTDPSGRLLSIPSVSFADRGGYKLVQGQTLKISAAYDNPTGRFLPEAAMGVAVGYFLPDQDSELASLERHPAR